MVLDLDSKLGSYDENRDPMWLKIDFECYRVCAQSYSVHLGCFPNRYRRECVLENSNDDSVWKGCLV
jgi:hypothetical protein